MLIAFASGKGAPGVSTTAAALAAVWPQPVLLVEADPRGGTLLFGLGQGNDAGGRGLLGLQLGIRRQPIAAALREQLIQLEAWPNTYALPGVDSSRQSANLPWSQIASYLAAQDEFDVLVDCGALPAVRQPTAVWAAADLTVLVCGSTMASAHFAEDAGSILREDLRTTGLGMDRLVSVVVGPGRPYPIKDLRTFLHECAPVIGSMEWDPGAAAVFSEGAPRGRKLAKLGLLRSAAALANQLGARALGHRDAVAFVPPSAKASEPLVDDVEDLAARPVAEPPASPIDPWRGQAPLRPLPLNPVASNGARNGYKGGHQ